MRIAVYGGAFNPPTLGHLDVLQQVHKDFDAVWIIPSYHHAFEKKMIAHSHRVAMMHLLLQDAPLNCKIMDVEPLLYKGKALYSYDILSYLKLKYKHHFTFVCGPDNAKPSTWQQFYRHRDIERDFGVYCAQEKHPIRSTLVRQNPKLLSKYCNPAVREYIESRNLYGT